MTDLDLTEAIYVGRKALELASGSVGYHSNAGTARAVLERQAAQRGYEQAIATLRDVAQRTGSPAAQWAADYLTVDPDRLSPRGAALCKSRMPGDPAVRCSSVADHPNVTFDGVVFNHGNPTARVFWNDIAAEPIDLSAFDFGRIDDTSVGVLTEWREGHPLAPATRYPHAGCPIEILHLAHPWGDPQHWCNGTGKDSQ